MWHGCRSRVVGSHQEALSYGERGLHPRAPCEAYTERASGLARGTPPYARHSAPRDSTRPSSPLVRPRAGAVPSLSAFREGGGPRSHRNHRPSSWFHYECFFIVLSVLLLIGVPRGAIPLQRGRRGGEEERNLWARNLYGPRVWYSKSSISGRIIFNLEVTVFGLNFFMPKRRVSLPPDLSV